MYTIWNGLLTAAAVWALVRKDYHSAIANYLTLLLRSEKRFGSNSIQAAQISYKLAHCYHHSGGADNFRFAILLYTRALNIVELKNSADNDALLGDVAKAMGDWYSQIANYSMADPLYQKSIQAYVRRYGEHSNVLLTPLYARLAILKLQGQDQEAADIEAWTDRIIQANRYLEIYQYHGRYPHL